MYIQRGKLSCTRKLEDKLDFKIIYLHDHFFLCVQFLLTRACLLINAAYFSTIDQSGHLIASFMGRIPLTKHYAVTDLSLIWLMMPRCRTGYLWKALGLHVLSLRFLRPQPLAAHFICHALPCDLQSFILLTGWKWFHPESYFASAGCEFYLFLNYSLGLRVIDSKSIPFGDTLLECWGNGEHIHSTALSEMPSSLPPCPLPSPQRKKCLPWSWGPTTSRLIPPSWLWVRVLHCCSDQHPATIAPSEQPISRSVLGEG